MSFFSFSPWKHHKPGTRNDSPAHLWMCFRTVLIANGKLPIISKIFQAWFEIIRKWFVSPCLEEFSCPVCDDNAIICRKHKNSLINIRPLGNVRSLWKAKPGRSRTAIKIRGFGLIDLIGSYLSVLFPSLHSLYAESSRQSLLVVFQEIFPTLSLIRKNAKNPIRFKLLHRPGRYANGRVLVRDS